MELYFDRSLAATYHSHSQIARVLTEKWMSENMFCPHCGRLKIEHFPNNKPVADFYCPQCHSEYELKSKNGKFLNKVCDGAYETMIQRITSNKNPDFFFMSYSKENLSINNLIFVPKHFFTPDLIEKRNPLSNSARRTGWEGCNILLGNIPSQGKIKIISNGIIQDISTVIHKVQIGKNLETDNIKSRSWLLEILCYVNKIPSEIFRLEDIYCFAPLLEVRHPKNHNIKAKIRQQLQFLRDKGFIEFLGNGLYRKV